MEDLLDAIWFKIVDIVYYMDNFLDVIFAPLNYFGPAVVISMIAFITVIITKFLTKTFKTKRYKELEKEFQYWYNVRQEALKCEDPEKGKLLAKNIDQVELNQVYYNYFIEGFFMSLATKCLPIIAFLAYVNETYNPNNLLKLFGREYILRFTNFNGEIILIGAAFWFVISIMLIYLGWFVIGRIFRKRITGEKDKLKGESCSSATSV
jgi:uncharacterized membrane protein (DUF106 family)